MTNAPNRFSQPQFLPLSLARAVWKHKLVAFCIWLSIAALGVFVSRRLPAVYKAEALILVDPQKVPERFVETTVTEDLQDRLTTISQEIQSTPRLQEIIDELGLYREARKTHYREDIIAMMRKDIEVKVEKGRAFRISYLAPDPQTAAKVVNRITGLYMDENLKSRETQAEGTTEFLQAQLAEAKTALEKQEAAVSRYKITHNGELPEQETSLSGALARLQIELQGNQDATNRAQQEQIAIESALSAAESSEAALKRARDVRANLAAGGAAANSGSPVANTSDTELAALKTQLAQLQERYTDDFPDVERLRTKISRLERNRAKERLLEKQLAAAAPARQSSDSESVESAVDMPELIAVRERLKSLRSQLAAIKRELAQQQADRGQIIASIAAYEGRLGQLPLREQEMASLTRDYEISKANYKSLLDKKIAAEMAGDLEHRQKAERFRILDPAKAPDMPAKPNRRVLYAASLIAGLVLSLALAIGIELRKGVLLGDWELPKEVEVLAKIPEIVVDKRPGPGSGLTGEARPLSADALVSLTWVALITPALLALLREM